MTVSVSVDDSAELTLLKNSNFVRKTHYDIEKKGLVKSDPENKGLSDFDIENK